jgi:hypothetical protein
MAVLPHHPWLRPLAARAAFGVAGLGLLALAACRTAPVAARPMPGPAVASAPIASGPRTSSGPQAVSGPQIASGTFDADVRALLNRDFTVRSLAAGRLVKAGVASLPALGQAGPQRAAQPGSPGESTTAPVIAAIVDELETPQILTHLSDPYPMVREAAVHEAGRRQAWDAVPTLIDRLADPSADVRVAARDALKRISGELGDPLLAGVPSTDLQQRWRAWWGQVGRARAAASNRRG